MGRVAPPALAGAVLPGQIAQLLADRGAAALAEALELVVTELGLLSAVLREADSRPGSSRPPGRLLALAGEAVHAVPPMRVVSDDGRSTAVELTVRFDGRDVGVLSVLGAHPSALPALRACSAVLGLALSQSTHHRLPAACGPDVAADLVAAADAVADATADRLHDGPVQSLVVAHYAAEAAVRGGDPTAARDAVQGALVELRRALWHLRPRGADDAGLPGALGLLSARLEEAGRPPLGLVLDETLAAALPPALVSTAYRLVQAIALPTGAEPVRVALHGDGPTVVLEIEGGAPLPDAERWAAAARALGGSFSSTETHSRLGMPLTAPQSKANS